MSKKRNKHTERPEIEKQTDYYRLKTDAVNDLVTANEENSPEVPEEELRAYYEAHEDEYELEEEGAEE